MTTGDIILMYLEGTKRDRIADMIQAELMIDSEEATQIVKDVVENNVKPSENVPLEKCLGCHNSSQEGLCTFKNRYRIGCRRQDFRWFYEKARVQA